MAGCSLPQPPEGDAGAAPAPPAGGPELPGSASSSGRRGAAAPTRGGSRAADEPTRVSQSPADGSAAATLGDAAIEGYQLQEELHRGGQGVVYRAIQLGTKRQVALKVLLEGPFAGEPARRRFEREVELAASLRHAHIVTILDSGISHGRYYFAMDYVDGLRLDRYLAKVRLPLRDTLLLFATIAETVNFAHQRGVIHRDLKPPNILVDGDGEPHVLDFGLAKPIQPVSAEQPTVQVLSTAGELLGTVAYMSPEQTRGALDVDVRSDVYSLGVVFYEALLGQLPYSVEGPLGEVLTRIAQADPERPRNVRRRSRVGHPVNDELETILLKALEKDVARRYQTAGELAADLRRLLSGQPIEAKRASGLYVLRTTLRRYRIQASVAATALLMMVFFLAVFAFLWRSEREASRRADRHLTEALQRAIQARQARDTAVRAERELRAVLIRQTIQRGQLAEARGDLIAARDFYWDAYEASTSPAALWALRRYYRETGDAGAGVLYFESQGPVALSPNARLAAVCETSEAVTLRDVERGHTLGWLSTPGPVTALHVTDQGTVCAAGPGWARLWSPGSAAPAVAAELADGFRPAGVHAAADGRRLLLVGAERVVCLDGSAQSAVTAVALGGPVIGPGDYSPSLNRLAVATPAGVQMISVGPEGALRSELIDAPEGRLLAVRFAGNELMALSADATYRISVAERSPRRWVRAAANPPGWTLFASGPDANTWGYGVREGHVALFAGGTLKETWRITAGELRDLRLAPDGRAVVTLDDRGTVTRWLRPDRAGQARTICERPPLAWAVAEDGSSVLLADDRQRVLAYAPQRSPEPETIAGRRAFSLLPGRSPEAVLLAASVQGLRAVVCFDTAIRLRDARSRTALGAVWGDPHVSVLRHAAITGDGGLIALGAETPAGDRQQVSFWKWEPRIRAGRNPDLSELLPPARGPVVFVGSAIRQMVFRPRTARLLVARSNGELLWLDADRDESGAPPPALQRTALAVAPWVHLDSPPVALAFDRRGEQVVVACEDGFVRVLEAKDGHVRARLRIDSPARLLAPSPHGDVLMVCTADGAVGLYELEGGESVAQLAPAAGGEPRFAAWVGTSDALLIGYADGVREHAYRETDQLIARSRTYARLRAVARHLTDGDLAAAWETTASLHEADAELARSVRETILEAALRRGDPEVPATWTEACVTGATAPTLLRLGHAAYDGERFDLAEHWLRQGREAAGGEIDAGTALHIAQCDYLAGRYEQAAEEFRRLLERPDLDSASIPSIQLQQTAALVLGGRREEARAVALRIGSLRRDSPRADIVATTSARDIARFLTDLESESLLATSVERLLAQFAEGALRFHDDGPFFAGELLRYRGDPQAAAASYQRCLDLARDSWPANWARFRLGHLAR